VRYGGSLNRTTWPPSGKSAVTAAIDPDHSFPVPTGLKRDWYVNEWRLSRADVSCPNAYHVIGCRSTRDPTAWGDWSIAMATATPAASDVGIHNVLIATDFSHQCVVALNYGLDFVRRYGAHAEIVYVLPTDEYALAGPEALTAAKDAARRELLELKSKLRRSQAFEEVEDCRVTMLEGPVADCLLEWTREKGIDLIVVGTHGRRGLGKVILGSVAEKVFRHSDVPVLTIGPHTRRHREIFDAHRILAPCDLTLRSHPAMQFACALARQHNARLTVLHVMEHADEGLAAERERIAQCAREELARIVGQRAEGVDVRYRIETGKVPATILAAASEMDADLIVLGVRPSSGVLDRFMWPIAYELVGEAACPVLTIRGSRPSR
jgi:nucleotide-binding universal stress UspA family protein